MWDFMGVIILESLSNPTLMERGVVTVIKQSNIQAPPDDPYPIWSRCLVRISGDDIYSFVDDLAHGMKEDFYNHFVDDETLIVVFKDKYFVLDKHDKSNWGDMIGYGKTVRVGSKWTMNIPVEFDKLL